MFTPKSTGTRPRASPFTPQRTPQTKRGSGLFTTQSRRSSHLGRIQSTANRSHQTCQILQEASHHHVDSYGVPLPVLITEALTLADRSTEITVNIDPSGWAWLVGGRKLFVWRYKLAAGIRGVQCKELTLPPSDLAHGAERVCVIPNPSDGQPAACVAVSPEGVVRYWPNIAYESSTAEISAELKGEECALVINFQPYGCLLATTTSSLVLLVITPGQNTITCQPLKSAQGMFAGISRRMSSFIFGSSPLQATGAPLQAVIPGSAEEERRCFFVLSGTHLQKWEVSEGTPEKLLYQIDADRLFRETLARTAWDQDSVQLPQLRTWLLDMKTTINGIMILGAGVNLETSPVVYYALGILETVENNPPSTFQSFVMMEHNEKYEEEHEIRMLGYHLLVPDIHLNMAYVYDKRNIFIVQVDESQPCDKLELLSSGDQLLGSGSCDGTPLFFSSAHGLFSVASTLKLEQRLLEESALEALARSEVSTLATSLSQVAEMSTSEDKSVRLKAAFISSLSGSLQQAQTIVEELFPLSTTTDETTTDMDKLVATLSRDLIDDYPTSDPRWAESLRQESARSSSSLIITQQLRDKQKAHDYLIGFLKKVGLWNRLSGVAVRDTVMSTRLLLCEHAEKLEAAISLRELHSEHTALIDSCIRWVLETQRGTDIPSGLTPQDVFYREVSRVQEILVTLIDYEMESISADLSPKQKVSLVSTNNGILEGMLHGALQYRQSKVTDFQSKVEDMTELEYIPWTSSGGSKGIRTLLSKQFSITLESAIPEVKDVESQGVLFQQVLGLADIILDGYSCQLESLRRAVGQTEQYEQLKKKYEQERHKLISPLMDYEQHERAASLAEKYFDFECLIRICEVTKNQDRLQRYSVQFSDRGFSNFLFHWFMKEGKRGRLLSQPVSHDVELSDFLESENTKYLRWLHDISTGRFVAAHDVLMELSRGETTFLAKKKTMLSLSKLAGLSTENETYEVQDNIKSINEELNLILHQEQLPQDVLQNLGMDSGNMRVLSPEEIIELYVGELNESATEYDFKKALDLLQYVDKTDPSSNHDNLQHHIWCRAILRDNWTKAPSSDPLETIRESVFFKTVDLAYAEGVDLKLFLPGVDSLLSADELGKLKMNASFQYLLRAGYEHINGIMT